MSEHCHANDQIDELEDCIARRNKGGTLSSDGNRPKRPNISATPGVQHLIELAERLSGR